MENFRKQEPNEEISIDFAGPFQNAHKQKKYLLVSVDNHSGWPQAMFLPNPMAEKVIEFLTEYIATNGIPKVGRKPNTLKSVMVEKCLLERDPLIDIEPEDFSEADSTILVRERMRGTKLEGAFKKVRGTVVGQSEHTISILPKTGKKTTYSMQDVAWQSNEAEAPQCSTSRNLPKPKRMANMNKRAKEEKRAEMGIAQKWTKTAIDTESSEDDRERVVQPATVQPTAEREQKLPRIKINESSEEDAIEQTEEENRAELEKEDGQEIPANKQNAPSTSGAKGVPIKGSVK